MASASSTASSEHLFEDVSAASATEVCVGEIEVEIERLSTATSGRATSTLEILPLRAELVVLLPFLGVAKNFVGFVDVLELGFSFRVARIDIWVELPRQLSVGSFYVFVSGILGDT